MKKRRTLSTYLLLLSISSSAISIAQDRPESAPDMSLDSLLNIKVSSAAKYDQSVRQAPASVSIITSDDIDRYGYQTLDEVLQHVRGFYTSNDRNYSYVGARGFGRSGDYNNRILLLLNGHTLNENVYGSALIGHELGFSLNALERIEIVRGPGSSLFGNNAMFAVVNLITKKGNLVDGAKVSLDAGNYGFIGGSARVGKEWDDGTDVSLSAHWTDVRGQDLYYREFDDPATNNGVARGIDWETFGGLTATLQSGNFFIQGIATSRKKGIPTGAFGVTFNDPRAQTLDERFFLEAVHEQALDASQIIKISGHIDRYHYAGRYPYEAGPQYESTENLWLGAELQFIWDIHSSDRITLGAEFDHNLVADYQTWVDARTYFDRNFPFSVLSAYVQNDLQINEYFSLTIGLRVDKNANFKPTLSPRTALIMYPSRAATLKFLYGEAFRAPNIYELYYEDAASGAKGNPGLTPERIKTLEFVWEQRISQELFGVLTAYDYSVNNLIDQTIDDADSMSLFRNMSEASTGGIELEINARTSFGLHGSVSYALQNAVEGSSDQSLTNSPKHLAKAGLSFQATRRIGFSLQAIQESGRKTSGGQWTSGMVLINAGIFLKRGTRGEEPWQDFFNSIKSTISLRNVFNEHFETPAGLEHRQLTIPQNGRNVNFSIEYAF